MMFDANKFTVAMVTKKGFERFSDDELHYCYAYRWNYLGYSEQKASDKSDDVKDILKETGLLTDFVKASLSLIHIYNGFTDDTTQNDA